MSRSPPFRYTNLLSGPLFWPEPADVPFRVEGDNAASFLCESHGVWFASKGHDEGSTLSSLGAEILGDQSSSGAMA